MARPQLARAPPEEVELDVLIAARARVRRPAGEVLRDERLHHGARERVAEVEHVVRDPQPVGHRARIVEVVERAAAPAALPRQAQRDADDVMAGGDAARRGDGAVDAAAHRHDDPHAAAPAGARVRMSRTRRGRRSTTASISPSLVVRPEAQAEPAARRLVVEPHGAEHVRRLGRPGRTRRAERDRDAGEVEEHQQALARRSPGSGGSACSAGGDRWPVRAERRPGPRARIPSHSRSASAAMRGPAACSLRRRCPRRRRRIRRRRRRFSVPARSPRSCGPPVTSGCRRTPRRTQSAPVPGGPPSLWLDSESRSTPSALTSTGTRPAACAASVCTTMPRPRSASAIAPTGASAPDLAVREPDADQRRASVAGGDDARHVDAPFGVDRHDAEPRARCREVGAPSPARRRARSRSPPGRRRRPPPPARRAARGCWPRWRRW